MRHPQRIYGSASSPPVFLAAWALIPALVLIIYLPGLNGPFVFDDITNILTNPAVARPSIALTWVSEILHSGMAGPLGRPLAYLSFGLNHHMAGGFDNVWVFKLTNLAIHIVNSLLVWHLINLLVTHLIHTARLRDTTMVRAIPLITAMLFAVHPIQLTSVLYVVQRMTSLSALFVLGGLSIFLRGRLMLPSRHAHAFLLMGAGMAIGLLGLASKENAILVIPLAAVIEYAVLTRDRLSPRIRGRLGLFYLVTTGVPLFIAALWMAVDPALLLKSYETRDFGLTERFLTEARILWFYLYLLAVPQLSTLSLFHDDIAISRALFEPITTSIAIVAIVVLISAAVQLRHRLPLVSFSIIWFFVAHALESGIIGLELAHEHRNYLPSLGFMLLVAHGITALSARTGRHTVAVIIITGVVAVLGATTFARSFIWSDEQRLIRHAAENHLQSPRSQFMYGEYLLSRASDPGNAINQFANAARLDPSEPAYLIAVQRAASSVAYATPDHPLTGPDSWIADGAKNRVGPASSGPTSFFQEQTDRQGKNRLLLHPGIAQQVEQRLRSKPASPTAILQIITLLDCVADSPTQCSYAAPYATSWALAAADNALLAREPRRNLLVRTADVHITEKNYVAAMHTAFIGIAHAPRDANYRIMAADTLLFLDRCQAAQDQLQNVLENDGSTAEDKSTARALLLKARNRDHCRDRSSSAHSIRRVADITA